MQTISKKKIGHQFQKKKKNTTNRTQMTETEIKKKLMCIL